MRLVSDYKRPLIFIFMEKVNTSLISKSHIRVLGVGTIYYWYWLIITGGVRRILRIYNNTNDNARYSEFTETTGATWDRAWMQTKNTIATTLCVCVCGQETDRCKYHSYTTISTLPLGPHLEQHVSKWGISKFKMSLVVELEEGRTVGVLVFEMNVMDFGFPRGVTALFAYVDLCPPFLIRILMLHPVNLETVGLQRTSLSKGLFTHVALVWSHPCVRPRVSF